MKTHSLMSAARFESGVLPRRTVRDGQPLEAGDDAVLAVTDFTREPPVTVDAERQIDEALNDMVTLGVRALLVYKEQQIVGLITSYDIQGERPMQYLQASNYQHHRDIRVADIMTPWDNLVAIDWSTLQQMCAGDLLDLLTGAKLTHVIVVEPNPQGAGCLVRALVSRARLLRQMGVSAGR